MTRKVGFIGLGTMGSAMARNVRQAGFPLTVYNRSDVKAEPFRQEGVPVAGSPAELAGQSDVVIIMVTGPEALLQVLEQNDGVLAGMRPGTTILNMSTVSPEATTRAQELAEDKGGIFVEAPVSGTKKPAEEGTLVILAGGDREKIRELEPLLRTMGKVVVYCGVAGQGSRMKLAINLLLGGMMQVLAETMVFGAKVGLSQDTIFQVITAGPLGAPFYAIKGGAIRAGDFEKKFPIDLLHKDLSLVLETAGRLGVMLPSTAAARETATGARGLGLGDEDMAAVIKVLEKLAGLEVRD